MDALNVLTFYLIEKIEDEFKKFTGSRHAFACMVLQHYGVKVSFLTTTEGIVTSVDYDDIIRLFENKPLSFNNIQALKHPNVWHDN